MISQCPHCCTEQMVTAVALQSSRGKILCCRCGKEFGPRTYRVTPEREQLVKARLKSQQVSDGGPAAEKTLDLETAKAQLGAPKPTGAGYAVSGNDRAASRDAAVTGIGNPVAENAAGKNTKRLSADSRELIDELNRKVSALAARLGKKINRGEFEAGQFEQQRVERDQLKTDLANKELEIERLRSQLHRNMQTKTVAKDRPASPATNETGTQSSLMARQQLMLERERLQIEHEKIELERNKLQLEKAKLQLYKEQTRIEKPVRQSRSTIEYNPIADLLPRTPNAIERRESSSNPGRSTQSVRLELMPKENIRSIFRRKPTK